MGFRRLWLGIFFFLVGGGVPRIWTNIFLGSIFGPPISGNYHLVLVIVIVRPTTIGVVGFGDLRCLQAFSRGPFSNS